MNRDQLWPLENRLIDYGMIHRLLYYGEKMTHEQLYFENSILGPHINIHIAWVNRENRLGWGFADNWKNKRIDWYMFGADEQWEGYFRQNSINILKKQMWPAEWKQIQYDSVHQLFSHAFEMMPERRFLGENILSPSVNLWAAWMDRKEGIGWGFSDNWKERRIDWYMFGTEEQWDTHLHKVSENNQDDLS